MTVVLISQRAFAVKDADEILVLDDGRPAGLGTHEELLRTCEVYREICRSQKLTEGGAHEAGPVSYTHLDVYKRQAISFLRTFVFQVAVVLALPALIGLDGIWLAIVVAEALALLVTAAFLAAKREYYHYG